MEDWFHDSNDKDEVNQARPLIAKVLKMLQWLFPREDNTNGYCIPKMHGMAKFQSYIKRYGFVMNLYGGRGESVYLLFGQGQHRGPMTSTLKVLIKPPRQHFHANLSAPSCRATSN